MTSPTPAEFYSDPHVGLRFGVKDKLHPNGHSGQDINEWPGGTRIPAFGAGTVVARGTNSNFGNWLSVDVGGGWYHSYCHLQNLSTAPSLGTTIRIGSDAGPLGTTGFSKGNHLHGMRTRSPNPQAYLGLSDPLPYMIAARTSGGGGGGGITPEQQEEEIMYVKAASASTVATKTPVPINWIYKQTGDGPLTPISNVESDYILAPSGAYVAPWNGNDIVALAYEYGFAEFIPFGATAPEISVPGYGRIAGGGRLTGRIIFPDGTFKASPGSGGNTAPTAQQNAEAVQAILADDIAAINSNIDDAPGLSGTITLEPKE